MSEFIQGEEAHSLYETSCATYGKDNSPHPSCIYCKSPTGYYKETREKGKDKQWAYIIHYMRISNFIPTTTYFLIPLLTCPNCEGFQDGYNRMRRFNPDLPENLVKLYNLAYDRGWKQRVLKSEEDEKAVEYKKIKEEMRMKKIRTSIQEEVRYNNFGNNAI